MKALLPVLLLFLVPSVWPQTYPSRGIRIIVPYTPGGSTDLLGRVTGQKLNEAWGQPVVVDNRPGAKIGRAHV